MAKQPINQQKDFFVYVLGSRRNDERRTYVGWTTDLQRRLRRHNSGAGAKSTRGREWRLLYSENCTTRNEAMSSRVAYQARQEVSRVIARRD